MNLASSPWIFNLVAVLLLWSACSYTEKIKDGKTAYERKRYYQASEMLQDEFRAARSNLEQMSIAFLIGDSHMKFGDVKTAAEWFKIAYEGGYGPSALDKYASCLKQMEQYEAAADAFYRAGEEIGDRARYRTEVATCRQAVTWKADAPYSPYVVKPLTKINTPDAEYAPFPLGTDQLAFTSDRESSAGDYIYAWSGNEFSDVFVANLSSGEVKSFENVVNAEDNEGTIAISPDGEKMVFCRCFSREDYDLHCKLLISKKESNAWLKPTILPFVKDGINYRHPTFNDSSDLLVFTANIDEATNDYDLYASRLVDGVWQQPQSLGSRINSQLREGFPFLDKDTLYFSSTYGGMGGLDIYKTYILPNGQWAPRENLLAPINSGADDFSFIIDRYATATDSVVQFGYFSSNRAGGKGQDDLYGYEKRKFYPIKDPEPEEEFAYDIELDLRVFQKKYEDPDDPNSKVLMRFPLPDADIRVTEDGLPYEQTASNKYGILSIDLNPERTYDFFVSHEGFFNNQLVFSTKNLTIDSTKRVQKYEDKILLDKIFLDKEVVLENIYYDLDESFIREDAKPTLDELASLLSFNPQIEIQLSSHTDCRASDAYNDRLSQDRAQSAVDYLIQKGIGQERLVARGYGKTRLAISCACDDCTVEEHQANRRTTFKVIDKEGR